MVTDSVLRSAKPQAPPPLARPVALPELSTGEGRVAMYYTKVISEVTRRRSIIFFNGGRIARGDVSSTGAITAVHYYFSDHFGSHAVIENATGTACEQDIDYYPYGGEENDYCSTPVAQHYKFTGTERDSESGLDNFGARYNASTMGRFMSPDPLGGHQEDPQTLNRYSYVRNNPLSLTDPTGLDFYLNCLQDSSTCQGGHVGTTTTTTDANGNTTSSFAATVVTSASLQDPNSGNTATVNQNGVQITTGGKPIKGHSLATRQPQTYKAAASCRTSVSISTATAAEAALLPVNGVTTAR
jgi:RHS repeat-associated protein